MEFVAIGNLYAEYNADSEIRLFSSLQSKNSKKKIHFMKIRFYLEAT